MFHRRNRADPARAARHVCSRVSGKGVSNIGCIYPIFMLY